MNDGGSVVITEKKPDGSCGGLKVTMAPTIENGANYRVG